MTESRNFPAPVSTTLTLWDGSTLTVRKRLTAGEANESSERMYRLMPDNMTLRVIPSLVDMAVTVSYLLDWELKDEEGAPPAPPIKGLKPDEVAVMLSNLDEMRYEEIVKAVKDHEKAMRAERDAKKKSQGGGTEGAPSSPSQSGAAGTPSGSEASTKTITT